MADIMIPQAKKRIFTIFMVIYVIFGIFLLYLLFGNFGMEAGLKYNEAEQSYRIYVENQSLHIIKDISIKVEEKGVVKELDKIAVLKPDGNFYVNYFPPIGVKNIKVILDAPFHQTVSRAFGVQGKEIDFEPTLSSPDRAFVGRNFTMSLSLCNRSIDLNNITVTESHSEAYFLERDRIDVIDLKAEDCENIIYTLTPTQIGATTIYFNVKVQHFNELFEDNLTPITIEVIE
ncbi:MAG: hypothetical protein ABID38_01750 [Candidatus Diapherotrites archaeon]